MAKVNDVYREWLQITEPARPLNFYQLLRLESFEDDPAKIRGNYNKLNSHVRKLLGGQHDDQAHALVDELTKAMLCLTDRRRKKEYDASLGRTATGDSKSRSLEDILINRKVLKPAQLKQAQQLAEKLGVNVRDAVLQMKLAQPDQVMLAYAESLGMPYVELAEIKIDETLIPRLPALLARQHSFVPVMIDGAKVVVASPNPLNSAVEDEIRLRLGMPVGGVLCTPADIHEAIKIHYPREAAAAELGKGTDQDVDDEEDEGPKLSKDEIELRRKRGAMLGGMLPFVVFSILGTMIFGWDKDLGTLNFYLVGFGIGGVGAAIGWFKAV